MIDDGYLRTFIIYCVYLKIVLSHQILELHAVSENSNVIVKKSHKCNVYRLVTLCTSVFGERVTAAGSSLKLGLHIKIDCYLLYGGVNCFWY